MNHILIIIAFDLIIYFKAMRLTIVTDDIRWYKRIEDGMFKHYKGWRAIVQRLYSGGTFGSQWEHKIKIGSKTYAIDAIQFDHAFSVALHTLISVLIYMGFGNSNISLGAAILYSCNPVNHSTSLWLNGRRYAVNIILVLSSLIAWQHHAWWLAIPLWAITPLFQMTAIFTPIMFSSWFIPVILVLVVLFRERIMRFILGRQSDIYSKELLVVFPRRIIVVVKCYGFYFFHMILPWKVGMYYKTLSRWGVTTGGNKDAYSYNSDFIKGVTALVITAVACILVPSNLKPMVVFGAISLLQWCNIIYATQTIADRYCNMANVFMMFFLSIALNAIYPPLCFLFIGYYVASLWLTMRMYTDIWHFHKYHIWYKPECNWNWEYFASYFVRTEQWLYAWPIIDEGLKYHPNSFTLLYLAARCWKGFGNKKECMKYLIRAKENYYDGQEKLQEKCIRDFVLP